MVSWDPVPGADDYLLHTLNLDGSGNPVTTAGPTYTYGPMPCPNVALATNLPTGAYAIRIDSLKANPDTTISDFPSCLNRSAYFIKYLVSGSVATNVPTITFGAGW